MEKIFTVVEVPGDKKVNIGIFYLTGETDIWWNTVKTVSYTHLTLPTKRIV